MDIEPLKHTIFAAALIVFAHSAHAAEIAVLDLPGFNDVVSIKGPITEGDSGRFLEAIAGRDQVTVMLESPGGLVRDALAIGAEIRLNNYATMVLPDTDCYSACALIWVAGARRYMSETSSIGFHAVYRRQDGQFLESGVGNAEVGSFLSHLGLRIEAIRFFTIAGPSEFEMLTPTLARALGIEIYKQDGLDVQTPEQLPTVDEIARRFMSASYLTASCSPFFGTDTDGGRELMLSLIREGTELVGSDMWIDVWTPMLDNIKAERQSKGTLQLCLETEQRLRSINLPTGVYGPSYDCTGSATETERSICENADIWPMDRAMSAIYAEMRALPDSQARTELLNEQRAWLGVRNLCDGDSSCLTQTYLERLWEFWDLELASN